MSPNLSFIGKCVGTLASADVVAQDAVRLALQSLSGCNSLLAYKLCQLSVQRAWFRAARLQSWIAWCSSSAVHNVLKISAVALASSNQVVDKSTAAYVCKCLVSRLERNQFRSGVCTEHGRPRRLKTASSINARGSAEVLQRSWMLALRTSQDVVFRRPS